MATNLNAVVAVLLAVAALLHGSAAHTRHVVGDSTGWTIPSGDDATCAATKIFTVGDTLVFNSADGQHNVAKVTKSVFDACNGSSTFYNITNSPADVTFNISNLGPKSKSGPRHAFGNRRNRMATVIIAASTTFSRNIHDVTRPRFQTLMMLSEMGEQYFICTIGDHCSFGQKLAITVTQKVCSSTTYPQDSSAGSVTYIGDTTGCTIPDGVADAYETWASSKTFKVGDILEFNYQVSLHNVEEVTKEDFDSCNSESPLAIYSNPPVRVTLNKPGPHYFLCGVLEHCLAGQKLAINVVAGTTTATPSSSTTTPPSSATSFSPPSPAGAGLLSATMLSIAAVFFY